MSSAIKIASEPQNIAQVESFIDDVCKQYNVASGHRGPRSTSARSRPATARRRGVPAGLSLVGCRVHPADDREPHALHTLHTPPSGMIAAVAMLGPDRMDYESVIPLVEYAARARAARASE